MLHACALALGRDGLAIGRVQSLCTTTATGLASGWPCTKLRVGVSVFPFSTGMIWENNNVWVRRQCGKQRRGCAPTGSSGWPPRADRRALQLEDDGTWGSSFGKRVMPWVFPSKGIKRIELRGRLSCISSNLLEILERFDRAAYRLILPSSLDRVHNIFRVSMRRQHPPDLSHILDIPVLSLRGLEPRGGTDTNSRTRGRQEGQEVTQPSDFP